MESGVSTQRPLPERPSWLRVLRVVAPLVWLAATVWFVAFEGLPLTRDWIAAWILLGLLAFSLGDIGGWFRGVVLDWLPFFGILALYDLLRGAADGLIFEPFFLPQIDVDRFLFGGTVPTVWLQERLYDPGTLPWYAVIAWAVYMSHFFATPLLAGILWKLDRARFRRFAVCVAVLALLGFATYALFPAAPPWMASDAGLIGHTARVIPEVWGQLGIPARFGVVGTGYEYANDVAAVPSLHAAYSLLIAIELWSGFASRSGSVRRLALRALLATYPLAMAFALVYSGEHYVSDILLGWLYAVVTVVGVRWAFARWALRRRDDRNVTSGSLSVTSD
jgi:membrane-associated phospholipid phosphatase